jgi:hypothetical protein
MKLVLRPTIAKTTINSSLLCVSPPKRAAKAGPSIILAPSVSHPAGSWDTDRGPEYSLILVSGGGLVKREYEVVICSSMS